MEIKVLFFVKHFTNIFVKYNILQKNIHMYCQKYIHEETGTGKACDVSLKYWNLCFFLFTKYDINGNGNGNGNGDGNGNVRGAAFGLT